MSRLVETSRRIEFVILRTDGSLPVALHPASRRRSYLLLRGLGLPRHGLTPCCYGAFAGALIPAKAGIQTKRRWPMNKQPSVYILASKRNGTLYVGVTSNLVKRVWEHKNDMVEGFTKRYAVHRLVWYELHENMESAISREKRIKNWKRKWKLQLIEKDNSNWQDLYYQIV